MADSQVRVVVRVRPLLPHEIAAAGGAAAVAASRKCVQTSTTADGVPAILLRDETPEAISSRDQAASNETLYSFDGVYEAGSTNASLFDAEVGPHVARLFTGSSVTLFAFGMTGTVRMQAQAVSLCCICTPLAPALTDVFFLVCAGVGQVSFDEWHRCRPRSDPPYNRCSIFLRSRPCCMQRTGVGNHEPQFLIL